MSDIKKGETFGLHIQKKNPKPNAPEYNMITVQEIFDILTPENMNRFFKDFKTGMSAAVHLRQVVKEIANSIHAEAKDLSASDIMKMPSFKWIDD